MRGTHRHHPAVAKCCAGLHLAFRLTRCPGGMREISMRLGIRLWPIGLRTAWIREAPTHLLEPLCAGQKDLRERV